MIFCFVGFLDTMSWISYLLGFDVANYYNFVVIVKICLVAWKNDYGMQSLKSFLFLALISLSVVTFSIYGAEVDLTGPLLKLAGFFTSLGLSIYLTNNDRQNYYFMGVLWSLALCVFLYFTFFYTGKIEDSFGRYLFFGGTHPNLGGEIFAAGALSLALLRPNYCIAILFLIFFIASYLLQARAAMVTIILLTLNYLFSSLRNSNFFSRFLIASIVAILVLLTSFHTDEIFGISSQYRGMDSGLSGRDDLYKIAWKGFLDKPFQGLGYGFFDGERLPYVHNFFLQGLAEMGMYFVFIVAYLGYLLYCVLKKNLYLGSCILCLIPLITLNARFFNLNPFPFLVYLILLKKQNNCY